MLIPQHLEQRRDSVPRVSRRFQPSGHHDEPVVHFRILLMEAFEPVGNDVVVDSENGECVLLRLEGRVAQRDIALDDPIAQALGEEGYARKLALDMSEVAALDSSGVNWLLVRLKQTDASGGRLVLHSLSPIAMNVLKVLNLHTVFRLAESRSDAVRLLGDEQ